MSFGVPWGRRALATTGSALSVGLAVVYTWQGASTSSRQVHLDANPVSTTTTSTSSHSHEGRIIFMGSGSSTGVPRPWCMLPQNAGLPGCRVSQLAATGPPELNRNYRGNPSLLIHTAHDTYLQIDVGKTFRENAIRWYPKHGVTKLDAVLLTHGHADAILGLDDLRGLQPPVQGCAPLPVFLDTECMKVIETTFPYLIPKKSKVKDATTNFRLKLLLVYVSSAEHVAQLKAEVPAVTRWVASLDFQCVRPFQPFTAADLKVTPLPVMHGEDLVCLGFSFGKTEKVVYLSDMSRVLPETEAFIRKEPVSILIVDALFKERSHPTHFSLKQAVEFVRRIQPKRAILVGLSDDIEYHEVSAELARMTDINVELAFDGMAIDVKLK